LLFRAACLRFENRFKAFGVGVHVIKVDAVVLLVLLVAAANNTASQINIVANKTKQKAIVQNLR
jgi:ABC-type lipoprotein release transport system permease subunit